MMVRSVIEHLRALRQRQTGGLDPSLGTHQVGDLLPVLRAIVRDSDEVDKVSASLTADT